MYYTFSEFFIHELNDFLRIDLTRIFVFGIFLFLFSVNIGQCCVMNNNNNNNNNTSNDSWAAPRCSTTLWPGTRPVFYSNFIRRQISSNFGRTTGRFLHRMSSFSFLPSLPPSLLTLGISRRPSMFVLGLLWVTVSYLETPGVSCCGTEWGRRWSWRHPAVS